MQITERTIRLFLHLMGVSVWIGGQLVMGGLVSVARSVGSDAPRALARRFEQLAWPAFGLIVVTGIWNVARMNVSNTSTGYQITLMVKLLLVAVSGLSAFFHSRTPSPMARGMTAGFALLAALVAAFLGVMLLTGS